ncbi:MAG: hypothetical protein K5765_02925 [Clostridia bacterium]|nr:hypothetical protein [Clostridia bacterium]
MNFKDYKKDLMKKAERAKVENEINNAIYALTKKRDQYIEKARDAYKSGNKSMYAAYVSLLKNAIFNLNQTQDLQANYTIANDLLEMQQLNKKALKTMTGIMKDVYKTCSKINIKESEAVFNKALSKQTDTSMQLKEVLKNNQISFSSSVSQISDVTDDEINDLLQIEVKKQEDKIDDSLDMLEKELSIEKPQQKKIQLLDVEEKAHISGFDDEPKDEPKTESKKNPVIEQENVDTEKLFSYEGNYTFPPLSLLNDDNRNSETAIKNKEDIEKIVKILENKLAEFGIKVKTENYIVGSTFSRIELSLQSSTSLAQIAKYEQDITMALSRKVRLLLPIEGKDLIGVEVENANREGVVLKNMLTSDEASSKYPMTLNIGTDIEYKSKFMKLDGLPHLLVAGTTGSGKSCFIHSLINGIFYRYTPSEVRLVLIDFKRVEFGPYNGVSYLVGGHIYDEHESAFEILENVNAEMERRYDVFLKNGVRNITEYNEKNESKKMPIIITVIDEYADLVGSQFAKKIQVIVQRLAQKARACGIHLVIATQRPTVKVIDGVIKANFPTRIAFSVASYMDSMNIIDTTGAQNLVGKGDMLLAYYNKIERLQAPFISTEEMNSIIKWLLENN